MIVWKIIEMWSDAYDLPYLDSVKIFEFDLLFPRGISPGSSVFLVAEFDWDVFSLHQYTQVIFFPFVSFFGSHNLRMLYADPCIILFIPEFQTKFANQDHTMYGMSVRFPKLVSLECFS